MSRLPAHPAHAGGWKTVKKWGHSGSSAAVFVPSQVHFVITSRAVPPMCVQLTLFFYQQADVPPMGMPTLFMFFSTSRCAADVFVSGFFHSYANVCACLKVLVLKKKHSFFLHPLTQPPSSLASPRVHFRKYTRLSVTLTDLEIWSTIFTWTIRTTNSKFITLTLRRSPKIK